jgi:hypothetical protein
MSLTFLQAARLFQEDRIRELAQLPDGLRFLKLRSLSRAESLMRLYRTAGLDLPAVNARDLFRRAYEDITDSAIIERCIRDIYEEERAVRRAQEPNLVDQLYRLQEFNWGGLHQNSLEKTIVDNYVKRIKNYEQLCASIENELLTSLRGYVLSSWYNHWSSIIIEDIFKDNHAVLPAVGLVKKIDFFVNDTPFDLKVTYLPEGYVSQIRRAAGLRPELTLLKQAARRHNVPFTQTLPDNQLLPDLWRKIEDHPSAACRQLIRELRARRNEIVRDIITTPSNLITWLYEQQGVRRFDASNRLFLILIDEQNYFDSWKLKRAKPLMEAAINDYLDCVGQNPGMEITFEWGDGNTYKVTADLVLVRHNPNTTMTEQ